MIEILLSKLDFKSLPMFQFNVVQKASAPLKVYHSNMAVLPGLLFQLAGVDTGNNRVRNCYKYTIATDTWVEIAPLPGVASSSAVAFGYNGYVYYLGGINDFAFYRYDPLNNTWTNLAAPILSVSGEPVNGIYQGKLYVLGGATRSTAQFYDFATNVWTETAEIEGTAPYQSSASSFCMVGQRLYAVDRVDKVFYWYDVVANQWGRLAPLPASVHYGGAMFYYKGRFYLLGGWNGSAVNKIVWVYEPGIGWAQYTNLSVAQYVHHVQEIDGYYWLLGGSNNGGAGGGLANLYRIGESQ